MYAYIKMVNIIKKREKRRKKSREKYQNLSEEKGKSWKNTAQDRYKNLSEEEKQKKVEYMRNYYLAH